MCIRDSDKPANIHRWQAAGGIGIRFQANEDDFEYLKEELQTAIEIRDNRMMGSSFHYINARGMN